MDRLEKEDRKKRFHALRVVRERSGWPVFLIQRRFVHTLYDEGKLRADHSLAVRGVDKLKKCVPPLKMRRSTPVVPVNENEDECQQLSTSRAYRGSSQVV